MSSSGSAEAHEKESNDVEVHVQFMDGSTFDVSVSDTAHVGDLTKVLRNLKQPPRPTTKLKLLSETFLVLNPLDPVAPLKGTTVNAIYSNTSEQSYLVVKEGELVLVDEGDEDWNEHAARRGHISECKWVPAPEAVAGIQSENLAKESLGVTVSATSIHLKQEQNLLNVLRLGSKFGEPRCILGADDSFCFGQGDWNPVLTVDFGRTVTLTRVGATCYQSRWVNYFEVWSSTDSVSWESWGHVRAYVSDKQDSMFIDRTPTPVRMIRIKATSGQIRGAQIGPLFAYGYDEYMR